MTKRIIILERLLMPGRRGARIALRADVPLARQGFYANSNAISAYVPSIPDSQDTADLVDIRAGRIIETVIVIQDQTSDASATLNQFLALCVTAFNIYQTNITSEPRFSQTGSFWDGMNWTQAGA